MKYFLFLILFFNCFITKGQHNKPYNIRELDSIVAMGKAPHFPVRKNSSLSLSNGHISGKLPQTKANRANYGLLSASCSDTSGRFSIRTDSGYYYCFTPVQTADGNLLVAGQYVNYNNYKVDGFLLKCDFAGNVAWDKHYDSTGSTGYNFFNYYMIVELPDHSIILGGSTNNQATGNIDLLMTKTSSTGNIIWSKNYNSRLWGNGSGSNDYFYIADMKYDPWSGYIFFCGPNWWQGKDLVKLDPANGNIIWSMLYQFNGSYGTDRPFGFEIRQNEIRYFGRTSDSYSASVNVLRINKETGDTIQSKIFAAQDPSSKISFLWCDMLTVKENGNYLMSGTCYGAWQYLWNQVTPLYQSSVAEMDSGLNNVKAYVFRSAVESNLYNSLTTVYPDGSGVLSYMHFLSGYSGDFYTAQFKDGHILKRRTRTPGNEGVPRENFFIRTPDGADMETKLLGDSVPYHDKLNFTKLHISDTASECLGYNEYLSFTEPATYNWQPGYMGYMEDSIFAETPTKVVGSGDFTTVHVPGCSQASHCDTLKLSPSSVNICAGQWFTISIHKNHECGSLVPLIYDTAAVGLVEYINDTLVGFRYDTAWSGYIRAYLHGCTLLSDSVFVNIIPSPILELGPDTSICTGSSIVLNAHSGFVNYQWQDGSADSIFVVTQPGIYHVTVSNSCGWHFTDYVEVLAHAPIPLELGPDRTTCAEYSLQLHAPGGFISYNWSPDYYITGNNTADPYVHPQLDTTYILMATLSPGCFAYDSIHINVLHAPPINLGNDRDICSGDTALLDAGPGFYQYSWSNYVYTQQNIINYPGIYYVTGITSEGCRSYDTIRITALPLPVVNIDKNPSLCSGGDARILDAGPGFSYLWNTGAVSQTISVTDTGYFQVTVTGINHCVARDSVHITTILPQPSGFLQDVDSVCIYSSTEIHPLQSFLLYLWNTGDMNSSITISQPGLYWLDATDNNGCTGRDSIKIAGKQCLNGFYIPTAFSPDNNGLNEIFKPLIFGTVINYEFRIFNRWGLLVFETHDPSKGWNGNKYTTNAFVWFCRYQLAGEKPVLKKGQVVLVR